MTVAQLQDNLKEAMRNSSDLGIPRHALAKLYDDIQDLTDRTNNEPLIHTSEQSVALLPSIGEASMFQALSHICAVPYNKEQYDRAKTEKVIISCMIHGHTSILEHLNISLKCFTNIGTYKDYTRHRHCAFTIESTSFSKYDNTLNVIPAAPLDYMDYAALIAAVRAYRTRGNIKTSRDFLPQCCAATMIMTTNVREWRYIIALRGDPSDNPLTRQLRDLIWTVLSIEYPFFFPLEANLSLNPMCIYNAWGEHKPATLCSDNQ